MLLGKILSKIKKYKRISFKILSLIVITANRNISIKRNQGNDYKH